MVSKSYEITDICKYQLPYVMNNIYQDHQYHFTKDKNFKYVGLEYWQTGRRIITSSSTYNNYMYLRNNIYRDHQVHFTKIKTCGIGGLEEDGSSVQHTYSHNIYIYIYYIYITET